MTPVEKFRLASSALALRFTLCALAVLVCYQFQWEWLRAATCEWNLRLDSLFGVRLQRIAFDTVVYRGVIYKYAIACTMVDAFCGAIPLVWNVRRTITGNLRFIAVFAAALFVFNIARLSLSDVLFAAGLSWNWAHNVMSGVCYFILWEWILRQRTIFSGRAKSRA